MTNRLSTHTLSRITEALIHIVGWSIVLAFPYFILNRSDTSITWGQYLHHGSIVPLSFLIVFYVNYCLLIPRYLFRGCTKQYLLINLLLILLIGAGAHWWQEYTFRSMVTESPRPRPMGPPRLMFFLRDIFSMVLTVGLSAAIRLTGRWRQVEAARREAEQQRVEAELKNLRNQLNPHFLLNTLNNIYALIAFNTEKAQTAVQELSKLLRHVLYDNQQDTVPLCKEADFIRNYIGLMRIRLSANVTVDTRLDIHPDSRTPIAPLIFISLIENAFKHGISPTQPSYIRICLTEQDDTVCCDIRNSYHPKTQADKSGSGIGLEQVKRRLELSYPGMYTWQQGVDTDKNEYQSILTIRIPHTEGQHIPHKNP